jgi:hypothetical protein
VISPTMNAWRPPFTNGSIHETDDAAHSPVIPSALGCGTGASALRFLVPSDRRSESLLSQLERVRPSSYPIEEASMSMQGPGGDEEPQRPGEDMPDPSPSAPDKPSSPTNPPSSPDEPDVEAPGSPEQEPAR